MCVSVSENLLSPKYVSDKSERPMYVSARCVTYKRVSFNKCMSIWFGTDRSVSESSLSDRSVFAGCVWV